MPLVLDWAIRDGSCAQAPNKPGYAGRSNRSECIDSTNGPGYFCNCTQGYEGNYIVSNLKVVNYELAGLLGTTTCFRSFLHLILFGNLLNLEYQI
jgi:hypothetical protein